LSPITSAPFGGTNRNVSGASVGLRDAVVRLQSIVTPAVMGVIAEAWGIEASFYCIGAAFVAAAAGLAFARLR